MSLWIIKRWYIENQSKNYYYFALEKDGKYYDYYKYYSYEISDGASIKLPSMRQVGTGYYTNATLGGYTWATVNYGNDKPWSIDTSLYVWPGVDATAWENSGLTELAERGEAVPTADQFTALYEGTKNYRIRVGGVMGHFFIDTATKGYMFIASLLDEDGHEDGIHCWSSTEYENDSTFVSILWSNPWETAHLLPSGHLKTDSLSVRAVKQ